MQQFEVSGELIITVPFIKIIDAENHDDAVQAAYDAYYRTFDHLTMEAADRTHVFRKGDVRPLVYNASVCER